GAYQAVLAAGKAKQIKIFGFDGADDVLLAIRDGKIEATGMQFPVVIARTAAELADRWIRGDRDFTEKMPVVVEMVTAENVDRYLPE
ncbi:MAG: substrate-binding domain-containing protein, partial [Rikenellaceae bacterium]|nr:substrate-binding domain-containing protein [Rikenellaceae bacterium]